MKEICEDAEINRATFYSHYLDQYDLLQQIENEIIDDINHYLDGSNFKNNKNFPVETVEKILEYIEENTELFNLLLSSNGDMKFQQEVIKIIGRQHFIANIGNESLKKEDAEYIYHFLACGSVGIIQMWLKEGMKKTSR